MLQNLQFSDDALGWLKGTIWPTFTAVAILMGFGHSILAMSGEESLAQVYREIEHPKVKNLKRAGLVIVIYSLLFTSLVSFFATAIIPDAERPQFYDNLISGLAMHVVGPLTARLLFQGFVVVVGFLMLAGAVNTAIVGSNGVLNRVSEDGVLTDWFRKPHKKYGTTYRLINLITLLQLVHDRREPRQRVRARRGVRVRRRLELRVQVAGDVRPALQGAGCADARVEGAAQPEDRRPRDSCRPRPDHGVAVWRRRSSICSRRQTATISGVLFTLMFYAIFVDLGEDHARTHASTRTRSTRISSS